MRGYPTPDVAWLGLLLISEKYQRQGIGTSAFHLVADLVRSWGTCQRVRGAVVVTNEDVSAFWRGLGFDSTGEVQRHRVGPMDSEALVFERRI